MFTDIDTNGAIPLDRPSTINPYQTTMSPVGQMSINSNWVDLNAQQDGYLDSPNRPVQYGVIATPDKDTSLTGPFGIAYGSYRKVPDSSVVIYRTPVPFGNLFIANQGIWTLPNGSKIALSENEMRYTPSATNIFNFSDPGIQWAHDISIRVTENTMPGMVAFGLVKSQTEADMSLQAGKNNPKSSLEMTNAGVQSFVGNTTSNLILIAGVAGLVYLYLLKGKK